MYLQALKLRCMHCMPQCKQQQQGVGVVQIEGRQAIKSIDSELQLVLQCKQSIGWHMHARHSHLYGELLYLMR